MREIEQDRMAMSAQFSYGLGLEGSSSDVNRVKRCFAGCNLNTSDWSSVNRPVK